ncbi:TPA: hypothetical protein HA317_03735 [Candidatus Woesearchaeota archaeon]|nr:hypothetical protein [Candidatus Woesearchaeota archaeon]
MLVLTLPLSFAVTPAVGSGVGIIIYTRDEAPRIWMDPNKRIVYHNNADDHDVLIERTQNYAFEGEQVWWDVLVYDKNGEENIKNVHATIGPEQGPGNIEEVECVGNERTTDPGKLGVYIGDPYPLTFDPDTMRWYTCKFTVEPQESMYGEYYVTVEAVDKTDLVGTMDENEYWFLNPNIAIDIRGAIDFGDISPGERKYSSTLVITNAADEGSAVVLQMFISGTDFYDPNPSGARCPDSNVLALNNGNDKPGCQAVFKDGKKVAGDNFCYFATRGAYSTNTNAGADAEGYDDIPYETGDPDNRAPIIDTNPFLNQGGDIAITFRLDLPKPCIGDFTSGQIYFWGEAV